MSQELVDFRLGHFGRMSHVVVIDEPLHPCRIGFFRAFAVVSGSQSLPQTIKKLQLGFGLGFSVITDRGLARSVWSNGSYAWGGFFHTAFQIDPQEELIAIFLCQLRPDNHLQLDQKVIQMAAQSIID